jgi:hypothetical protein
MGTYDGYFDGAGMARMLLKFTRQIEESLIRMGAEEASYEEEDK